MSSASPKHDRWRLRWPAAPLRTYLVAMILLATVPIAALMSLQLLRDVNEQQTQLEASLRQGSAALARSVERELRSALDMLAILARLESMQRDDVAGFELELRSQRLLPPNWSSAFVADRDGRVLFDTDPHSRRLDSLAALPAFKGLAGGDAGLVSNLVGSGARQATAVAIAVNIEGRPRYVLGAWIDAPAWQRMVLQPTAPNDTVRSVFDGQHRLIARSLAPARSVGQPLPLEAAAAIEARPSGFMRSELFDGGAFYAAWDTVAPAGWGASVGVPAAPVDAAYRRAVLAAIGTAAACLLLGVTLALLFARRLTLPLELLAERGPAAPLARIPVRELSLLRDALFAAQAQDELARDRLQKKADEFETLFSSSPLGLAFALDPECRQVLHNPAMTRLFGAPAVPGAAAPVQVRHRGRPLAPAQQPLQRAAAQGETVTAMELELIGADQPPRFVIANAVPLRDEYGQPRGAIGAVVDISERKRVEAQLLSADQRLRESQRLMDLAQEAGQVGFFHYRFETDRLAWTPGLAKLFGIAAPRADSPLDEWLHRIDGADRVQLEATLRDALARRQQRETIEFRVEPGDGAEARWLSSRVLISYADGAAPLQMIGVTVDVSESKRADLARAALIEREQAARLEAEASNRAKDEFLAMLGHELRNPLSAIASAVEVLGRVDTSGDMALNARNIIARQTRHLAHMMEDLLDVARVISGKVGLSRHPLDLGALVQRVAATLDVTDAARAHHVELRVAPVWIDADATRIDQVVNNLLTNALKYTPAGGRISVEVSRDGAAALLVVGDTGIGIPQALLPRVFDLFVQGERTLDRRAGGLGIGLTLVRRLVELHGGTIEAASSEQGSTFTVRWPALAAPPAAPPAQDAQAWPDARRRRIALIEDNEDAREALRSLLELEGHSVSTANDGVSGLASLLQARPDIAVVDIGLPGIDGFEVARRSRAAGYAGRMIALSGYGQQRDIAQALASGFDAHLVKPVDAQTLRALLEDG